MDPQFPQPQQPLLARVRSWMHAHKSALLFAAALLVAIGTAAVVYVIINQPLSIIAENGPPPKPKPKPAPKFYSPLTGVEVPDEAATKRQVTAIMIENSPDARPQSGLKDSGVVFEAIAEGGITRFLCVYQEARPGLIGPVRSLRPYYVDWLAPFDAAVAHIGGSKKALDEIRNGSYKDIDQFFNSRAYWRASDRYAPHNVYTNFDRLDELNNSKGFTSSNFTGFVREAIPKNKKEETAAAEAVAKHPAANSVNITVSSATYNVAYSYEKETNSYIRMLAGKPHVDREGGQIKPRVVIAIKVPTSLGFEDGYREQMETIGSGQAYIFQDGKVIEATWKKPGKRDQMRFVDAADKDIGLERGQTWITVIAPNKAVTWQ